MLREHLLQRELAELLACRLAPDIWWTMVDGCGPFRPWMVAARRARGIRSGVPDLLLVHRSRFVAVELKTPAGNISEAQKVMRLAILAAGGRWYCCRSIPAVLRVLQIERVPLLPPSELARLREEIGGIPPVPPFDRFNPLHLPATDPSVRRLSRQQLVAAARRGGKAPQKPRVASRQQRPSSPKTALATLRAAIAAERPATGRP